MKKEKEQHEIITDEDLPIRALELATKYHDGQVDKAGMPYIDHVIRVGLRAALSGKSKEEFRILLAIGFLHDILEDTSISKEELRTFIDNEIVFDSVVTLTRMKEESYFNYIEQLANHKYSTIVKLADLEDHLDKRTDFELPESLRYRYETAKRQLLQSDEYLKHLLSDGI